MRGHWILQDGLLIGSRDVPDTVEGGRQLWKLFVTVLILNYIIWLSAPNKNITYLKDDIHLSWICIYMGWLLITTILNWESI